MSCTHLSFLYKDDLLLKIYHSNIHKEHIIGKSQFLADEIDAFFEVPQRLDSILTSLKRTDWAEITSPDDFGLEPILKIHTSRYLEYLERAYDNWKIFSNEHGLAFIPYKPGFDPLAIEFVEIPDQDGFFMTDMNVPINSGTFTAALSSAFCALSAAQSVVKDKGTTFALSRPPGHHAGSEICGGFCFLNNAAIAAQWLSTRGKVAILDIDYHAGNGTQSIFYNRPDVLTISLHADPAWEYPSFAGHASEIGFGAGEGYHRNYPLPHQTDNALYREKLDQALKFMSDFSPDFLVISAGFDTFEGDPLGDFKITREGYKIFGQMLSDLKLPTTIILEGGYKIDELGRNVVALLNPFIS